MLPGQNAQSNDNNQRGNAGTCHNMCVAMSEDVIGLELGSGSLKVALVRDGMPITVASHALPQGVFSRGTLMQPQQLTRATKALIAKAHLPTKAVRISVPDPRLQVRSFALPDPGSREETISALRLNASGRFDSLDLSRAVMDYRTITADARHIETSILATTPATLAPVAGAIRKAGLKLVGIETPTTALARTLDLPEGRPTMVVLIDGDITHVALVENTAISYAHTFPVGTWDFWEPLIKAGYAVREAADLSRRVGVGGDPDRSLTTNLVSDVQNHLLTVFDSFVAQLDDTIDIVRSLGRAPSERLVVMGDGARIRGLAESIAQYLPGAGELTSARLSDGLARAPEPERYAVSLGLSGQEGPNLADFAKKRRTESRTRIVRDIDSAGSATGARARTKKRSMPKPYLAALGIVAVTLAGMSYLSGPLNTTAQGKEQRVADLEIGRSGAAGSSDVALSGALAKHLTLTPIVSKVMGAKHVRTVAIAPTHITVTVVGQATEALVEFAGLELSAEVIDNNRLRIPLETTP